MALSNGNRAVVGRRQWAVSSIGLYAARYLEWYPLKQSPDLARIACTQITNRLRFRAVAPPFGVIHVDPHAIRWRITVHKRTWPMGLIHGGDWDHARREPVDTPGKLASTWQRYRLGKPWIDTDIFRGTYSNVYARGGTVKGAPTLAALATHYDHVYDSLYERISKRGFVVPTLGDPRPTFVYVHIGRGGELLFTSGGHHRLGIALALGLRSIPVRVLTRHLEWQRLRESFKRAAFFTADAAPHPDVHDLLRASSASTT